MSSSSSPVLVFELRRPWLRLLPAGVLLASSLVMPWLVDIDSWSRGGLSLVGVTLALLAIWQSSCGRANRRLVGLSWQQSHEWWLRFAAGEPVQAALSGRSWRSPWLICLKFCDEFGRSHQVMLWRSELSASAWQQWQLRLRLEGARTAVAMSGLP